jgi:hypothetical protein
MLTLGPIVSFGRVDMKASAVGLLVAFLAIAIMPAFAEEQERELTGPEEMQQKQRAEAAEIEKAYKNTLKNTGSNAAAVKTDPWGNVRTAEPAQTKPNAQSKNPK